MNIDEKEIENFDKNAFEWWNKKGAYRVLHKLNPLRLKYIMERYDIKGKKILDIGCGGGLLAEELAKEGAIVTAIDASKKTIDIAKKHAKENNLKIDYQCGSIDDLEDKYKFDCIVCFELVEHVSSPNQLIKKISSLSKENTNIFISTINRNIQSFVFAKILAEYIFNIIPKGTHQYKKFIKPSELCRIFEKNNCEIKEINGMIFDPFLSDFRISSFTKINYFIYAKKNV
tara:strand:- start:203162 stop:203851 length:690 start_codon:yes stop_codon:yes gene_type:complete